ncbi:MAG: ORF6N domain-containing protein, partial [Candidatus Riflemargulisbacteria bacterium]
MYIINYEDIESKIIIIRDMQVILDRDVAILYGVTTKEVNQAVSNNVNKFIEGYVIEINEEDKNELVKNFDRFKTLKHSTVCPKAFSEKGLYMLATILKSSNATEATIAVIETFAKIRQLTKTIKDLSSVQDKDCRNDLMQRSGEIFSDILDDGFETTGT